MSLWRSDFSDVSVHDTDRISELQAEPERSGQAAGARYNRCRPAGCRQLHSINSWLVNLAAGAAQRAIPNAENSAKRLLMAAAPAGRAAPCWFAVNEIP
jgi:hypothetical protein